MRKNNERESYREKINKFSQKYLNMFEKGDSEKIIEEELGRDCAELGFIMDSGKAFERAYPCASVSNEVMKSACNHVTDMDLLGSAIYSQWRYYTHWGEMSLLAPKPKEWFTLALSRLMNLSVIFRLSQKANMLR